MGYAGEGSLLGSNGVGSSWDPMVHVKEDEEGVKLSFTMPPNPV